MMRRRWTVLSLLLVLHVGAGVMAVNAAKPPVKDPAQTLCVEAADGKGVHCFNRERDGSVHVLSGTALSEVFKAYWIQDRPVVYIDRDGASAIGYMPAGADDAMLYAFSPIEGPGMGLTAEPWWTDFWFSLDDEFWVTFERQIAHEHGTLLNTAMARTLDALQNYEVSADMEDDEAFTLSRIGGFAASSGAAPALDAASGHPPADNATTPAGGVVPWSNESMAVPW